MEGNILKMESKLNETVDYFLPIGQERVHVNPFLGKKISLSFDGLINCIATGEKIKKTYNQGYSYKAFLTKASCDICIVKPELCHYEKGTCREPKWGEEHCMKPHIVYLSNTSSVKIGITREANVPYRWIDQGAVEALPILRVQNRLLSGLVESEIKKDYNDKTNWRRMLKGDFEEIDLYQERESIFNTFGDLLDDLEAEDLDEEVVKINYPILENPKKITSLSFDKKPLIEGTLLGIKGQYLILDSGVLNIRKHQGYFINLKAS